MIWIERIAFISSLILLCVLAWEGRRNPITWLCVAFAAWVILGASWLAFTDWLRNFTVVS